MGIILLIILITHWVADFVLQPDDLAKNKATDNGALFLHSLEYTAIWFLVLSTMVVYIPLPLKIMWFIPITFISHFAIDYYTSKANKYLYEKGDTHNFFVSIGFDQILHYIQIYLTFIYLL